MQSLYVGLFGVLGCVSRYWLSSWIHQVMARPLPFGSAGGQRRRFAAHRPADGLDRFNRVDYNVLIDRLDAVYQRWNLTAMKIDSNSIGQPVIDQKVRRGMTIIPFVTNNTTKQVITQNLQSAFENAEISIIDNPVLVGELLSFESRRSQSGSWTYSAPEGMHDDCVMSLAIAWDAIANRPWLIS